MVELQTDEWYAVGGGCHPWRNREVLVRMSDGTKRTLSWNGFYWVDPDTNIRQMFVEDGVHPTHFYIFKRGDFDR